MQRRIIQIGSSLGITVPSKELERLNVGIGDYVNAELSNVVSEEQHSYPEVTVHGRFQPPVHINHWNYIKEGFRLGNKVRILITNPYPVDSPETADDSASWRTKADSNPFTYDERVFMFARFLTAMGIKEKRYSIEPFNINESESFSVLNKQSPNVVNVYSEWSQKKVHKFRDMGLTVIQLDQPKATDVSGTIIRQIINKYEDRPMQLSAKLIEAGFMPEAVPGLLEVLRKRRGDLT